MSMAFYFLVPLSQTIKSVDCCYDSLLNLLFLKIIMNVWGYELSFNYEVDGGRILESTLACVYSLAWWRLYIYILYI